MKTYYGVGVTALVIVSMSVVGQETAAQYPQLGQAAQGHAQSFAAAQNEKAARIRANLAKLPEEDRELVEAQGFCPIMVKNQLGVMGPPIKVMIKDQPVFVCCAGCRRKALANPDRTLAIVADLQAKMEIHASLAKLSPEDRQLAQAQGYCPVMTDNRLGVMGPPVKLMIGNQPVFLCCAGCRTRALANPDRTLAIVAQLQARESEAAARKAMIEQQRPR